MRDVEPGKPDYDRLRQGHHFGHLRCLCWQKRIRDDHTLSYANASAEADSESIDVTMRKRRTFFVGFVANLEKKRLPRRVMFGKLVEVKGYTPGGKRTIEWCV